LVWSDRRLQELARNFIPVADKVEPFQGTDSADESSFFWKISRQRKDFKGVPGQGVYAVTPSGKLLAFRQTDHDPARILELLEDALAQWKLMDPKERKGSDCRTRDPGDSWRGEARLPDGGLVLQLFVRDLPRQDGTPAEKFAHMWNQDYVWFKRDELRSMIPPSHKPGDRHALPDRLVRRLAKIHFVDLVRGVTPPYEDRHVEKAEMALVVDRLEGDRLHVRLEGMTRAERQATPNPRIETDYGTGYDGRILGRAEIDLAKEEFVAFEMVSVGTRWGGTRHNTRLEDNDVAPNPIGYALRLLPVAEQTEFRAPLYAEKYFSR